MLLIAKDRLKGGWTPNILYEQPPRLLLQIYNPPIHQINHLYAIKSFSSSACVGILGPCIWAGLPSCRMLSSSLSSSSIATCSFCLSGFLSRKYLSYCLVSLPLAFLGLPLGLGSSYLELTLQWREVLFVSQHQYYHFQKVTLFHYPLRSLRWNCLRFHLVSYYLSQRPQAQFFMLLLRCYHLSLQKFIQAVQYCLFLWRLLCLSLLKDLQNLRLTSLLEQSLHLCLYHLLIFSHHHPQQQKFLLVLNYPHQHLSVLSHVYEYSTSIAHLQYRQVEAAREGSIATKGTRHSFYNRIQLEIVQIHNLLEQLSMDRSVQRFRVNLERLELLDQHQHQQTQSGRFQTSQPFQQMLHSTHLQQLQAHLQLQEAQLEQQHLAELGFLEQWDLRQLLRHQHYQRMLFLFQKHLHLCIQMPQLLHRQFHPRFQAHQQFVEVLWESQLQVEIEFQE